MDKSLPVWVFMVKAENLDPLWQLVRELRCDGRLFRPVSIESPTVNQEVAMQQFQFPAPFSRDMPSRDDPQLVLEAATYNRGPDPNHCGPARSGGTPRPPSAPGQNLNVGQSSSSMSSGIFGSTDIASASATVSRPPPLQQPHQVPSSTYTLDLEHLINEFKRRAPFALRA